ncbi:MAG: hypothetical protein ABSB22_17110 [Thermodesulfobacteriota bacterium]|jgi:hypothetical protein
MRKNIILLLIGALILFFATEGAFAIPVKGTPPQYIGLGEFQNPVQGINFTLLQKEALNPNAPVIKHAYAVDRGIYGTILRIYIEPEDPNGDMEKITTPVDQVGYGHYPTDFIILKPPYRKDFKGYIQLNTFSYKTSMMDEWVRNYVTVAVIDKTGEVSNEFVFPFTFETGVGPAPSPPAPFDEGESPKLGFVFINLYNPFRMGGGNGNFN